VRVLLICPTYFSPQSVIAGAERYSYELAKAMARRTPTRLVTFGDEAFERREGALTVRCHRRWTYVRRNRKNPFTLALVSDVLWSSVVHCLQFQTVTTDLAILTGAAARRRVFITDLAGSADFSLSYHLPLWRLTRGLLPISKFNESLFADLPARKAVIYGGVDTERFRPESRERERLILFVGRLSPHKGLEDLFAALDPDMETIVAGQAVDAEYAESLRRAAAGKPVSFRENMSDADLLEAYHRASLVALPSLTDGGYTTALESMACATPVVGTAVGSLPELVADGETGMLVRAGDRAGLRAALRQLLDDPARARRMGEAGRRRVEAEFTWDKVVDRCVGEYTRKDNV
jgi:glycosyltransferase involved in cell wall biosynthesis